MTSKDLTYGFGLFRQDNSMLFQMQVLPGHVNDILWVFDRPGVYTIRSTEYSRPAGIGMIERTRSKSRARTRRPTERTFQRGTTS